MSYYTEYEISLLNKLKEVKWYKDLFNDNIIPSNSDVYSILNSSVEAVHYGYLIRDQYIRNFGYTLITKEFISELVSLIGDNNILEVAAGSGYLSKCIQQYNPDIIVYTTDDGSWDNWNTDYDIEVIDACDAIDKYSSDIKYVLLSWPEYDSPMASNVLRKCLEHNIPLIYIGTEYGGCTADDSFFNLMDSETNVEYVCDSYISFPGIYDKCMLITPI